MPKTTKEIWKEFNGEGKLFGDELWFSEKEIKEAIELLKSKVLLYGDFDIVHKIFKEIDDFEGRLLK